LAKRTLQDTYIEYRTQIDAITSLLGLKYRKSARVIAWLYGGTEESWRKLLAKKTKSSKMPTEVVALLKKFTGQK
jgi:hypothetical protein